MSHKNRYRAVRTVLSILLLVLMGIVHANASPPIGSGPTTEFVDSGQALGLSASYDIALGDVDGDGDLDAFVANLNRQPNRVWLNTGGSAGFSVTATSARYIPHGMEDAVLRVILTHNGLAADRDLELHTWDLGLLGLDCSTPLASAQVNARLAALRVRLDDGDGTFGTDSDLEVAGVSAGSFSLDGEGAQTIPFTNDDPNVQVSGTYSKTYWVSLEAPIDQERLDVCVNFDPDADASVEGKTPDFRVSVQDSTPTDTVSVSGPTVVEVCAMAARAAAPDRLVLLVSVAALTIFFLDWQRRRLAQWADAVKKNSGT